MIRVLAAYDPRIVAAILRDLPASARKPPPQQRQPWNLPLDARIGLAAGQALGWPAAQRWEAIERDGMLGSYRRARR